MSVENILLVSLSHAGASWSRRERAAVARGDLPETLGQLGSFAGLRECVILSTCSRTEIIGASLEPEHSIDRLKDWFERRAGPGVRDELKVLRGREAMRHTFRVAAGLDSWILGECEILAQVKEAYQTSLSRGATGPTLNRAFQTALSASKEIRTRTGIQRGVHSIGGAATLLARQVLPKGTAELLVVGAGQAAESVTRHLAERPFDRVIVANRTLAHAQSIAKPCGAEAVGLSEGLARLAEADVAVFSAACSSPLVRADWLAVLRPNRSRPLLLIDLGLPRNVEPECAELDGVHLYNLDDLHAVLAKVAEDKRAEKERAELLAALAADDCSDALDRRQLMPQSGGNIR